MPRSERAITDAPPERDVDVLRRALDGFRKRLPEGWSTPISEQVKVPAGRLDAMVEVTAPDGTRGVLLVEAKRAVVTRDLPALRDQLRAYIDSLPGSAAPMVVARYLSPSAREWLEEHGVSYADATGNMRVVLERPALYITDKGADRDPWRGPGRPRGTLKGAAAARVVRALADFKPPLSVPELMKCSGASTGATYRVVEFLDSEGLIERTARGPVRDVRWRRLLERWSEDYGFLESNQVRAYLQPRGLPAVSEGLSALQGVRYALTGSLAAQRFAPHAPPRVAMIYVDRPDELVERLGLRPVDTGGNVLLATGSYDVVFDRVATVDGMSAAAVSQTAVDLLTGPGRSPAEGEALLDWMEAHEDVWRQ